MAQVVAIIRKTLLLFFVFAFAQVVKAQQTYCNPLNIDYTYMIYNANQGLSYRSGADPAVVKFRNSYYMFVTRSLGYWHSTDLHHWRFVKPDKWYFQGSNAPAAFNYKDSVLYVAGDPSGSMSILYTDNPLKGDWKATPSILHDLQDPALFIDDDGRSFMYWGSSNKWPIRVRELDKNKNFKPFQKVDTLIGLNMKEHGWERFGHNHADTVLGGYLEGAWMTKHKGKYYLQYAAPGTEFNVYADGAYIGDSPTGPFKYMPNNPFSYKPGGYMNGAGHGSTVEGPAGLFWHFGSMAVSVNVNWERRLCMFPTYFDSAGLMYSNSRFGDYPHYGPAHPKAGQFTGWMLLSYKKPVTASSAVEKHIASNINDEQVNTWWLAASAQQPQWVQIDLEQVGDVHAIQINYHDYQSNLYGRVEGLFHRYTVEGSKDGKEWFTIIDKSSSYLDVPNDYIELSTPVKTRFIRYNHIHVPTPHLAISGLRVFGKGTGKAPEKVLQLSAQRSTDGRDVLLKWPAVKGAQGYQIRWGIAPEKLYSSWLLYEQNEHLLKSLTKGQSYYFSIEAFNENGVSLLSPLVFVK
ncbi:MAG: family 43 glycosylhydrolase [Sediminibacterium sp.]|nr:family 43 glycosylhydrolase [Sediminibacterium sp.]